MRFASLAALLFATLAAAPAAHADNFFEIATGFYEPVADDDYEDTVDTGS